MSERIFRFAGRRGQQIAMVDTTGGTVEAIRLDDNHVRKVLIKLSRNGVDVEMALPPAAAIDFATQLGAAIAWLGGDAQ